MLSLLAKLAQANALATTVAFAMVPLLPWSQNMSPMPLLFAAEIEQIDAQIEETITAEATWSSSNIFSGGQTRLFIDTYIQQGVQFTITAQVPKNPSVFIRQEKRKTNISERRGSTMWFGQRLAFQVSPSKAGPLLLEDFTITVTTDGQTHDLQCSIPPLTVQAPSGVDPSKPFIVAEHYELVESWQGLPDSLNGETNADIPSVAQGTILIRTIHQTISNGNSSRWPRLRQPTVDIDITANEPDIQRSSNRGTTTAKRTDLFRYNVRTPTVVRFPPIEVQWFQPSTAKVQLLSLPAQSLYVEPYFKATSPRKNSSSAIGYWLSGLMLGSVLVALWIIWLRQPGRRQRQALLKAIRQKDISRIDHELRQFPQVIQNLPIVTELYALIGDDFAKQPVVDFQSLYAKAKKIPTHS